MRTVCKRETCQRIKLEGLVLKIFGGTVVKKTSYNTSPIVPTKGLCEAEAEATRNELWSVTDVIFCILVIFGGCGNVNLNLILDRLEGGSRRVRVIARFRRSTSILSDYPRQRIN